MRLSKTLPKIKTPEPVPARVARARQLPYTRDGFEIKEGPRPPREGEFYLARGMAVRATFDYCTPKTILEKIDSGGDS
jgi:hypothetical protein